MKVKITADPENIAWEMEQRSIANLESVEDDYFVEGYLDGIVNAVLNSLVVEIDRDVDFEVDATILPFPGGAVG